MVAGLTTGDPAEKADNCIDKAADNQTREDDREGTVGCFRDGPGNYCQNNADSYTSDAAHHHDKSHTAAWSARGLLVGSGLLIGGGLLVRSGLLVRIGLGLLIGIRLRLLIGIGLGLLVWVVRIGRVKLGIVGHVIHTLLFNVELANPGCLSVPGWGEL